MLHRVILTAASVIALTAAAYAGDMTNTPDLFVGPTVPVYPGVNWGGFYAGVNVGAISGSPGYQFSNSNNGFAGLSPDGGFGGGQIGYNWQGIWHPHLVFGIEADIQGSGVSATGNDGVNTYKSELDYFGTVRGRAGYAFAQEFIYFTGGLAYGEVQNSVNNVSVDKTAGGYVLGGGIEIKLTPVWSVKGEYQYINLGKNYPSSSAGGATVSDDAYDTFRIGLNYFIGGTYAPLK